MGKLVRKAYVFILCAIYLYIEVNYLRTHSSELAIVLVVLMGVFTAPLGLVLPLFLSLLGKWGVSFDAFGNIPFGSDIFGFFYGLEWHY